MSISIDGDDDTAFHGAKLALFIGDRLATILRDDRVDIPWPAHWDLPGGGREGSENGPTCALRETREELGLVVSQASLCWGRLYWRKGLAFWFFAAHLPTTAEKDIKLGDEGQRWALVDPHHYLKNPKAIPQFQSRLADYLAAT
ncbi:8-oxo-dGTP diphosphatase [Shimia gijangensis]|uniref:8-oxo-dGTP diphosphatase n=1 Tax=Shimia gijangensis TaxID=1470563 RepID=A0A1M6NJR1_9RHOB|nr:NUDIX hydrolase [Shimia gijangensis]SHJ95909.1 8-oxo-dGTP diphosphatase [Shimia gijangensis]